MKESKDGTQEEEAKNYAYTNTLAIDEGEEQAVEKYDRRLSAVSSQRPSLVNGKIGAPDMKISEDLENGMNHGGNEVAPPGSVTLHVIVDCSEVSFIDVTGVSFLKKTAEECNNISVVLLLACTKSECLANVSYQGKWRYLVDWTRCPRLERFQILRRTCYGAGFSFV